MKKSPIILIVILMLFFLLSCDNKISHKEHDWKNRKVTKEATCTEDGEAIVSCSCGETKTIILEKLGHDIKEIITEPTPLKKGRIDYNCSRCEVTGLKESVELDRSIAGYGIESYDKTTGQYRYYKFEENGILYSFDYTLDIEKNAFMFYATPQKYFIVESENSVYLFISYKDEPNKGMKHLITENENDGTISTTYKSSSYPQEEKKTLVLTRNTNLADLPTQIILNNNANKQNQEDRKNTDINWDGTSPASVCQYVHWDNDFLKKNLPDKKIFVSYSEHVYKYGDSKCTVCGRDNTN